MSKISLRKNFCKFDYILLFAVLALVGIGVLFVYSASNYSAQNDFGNPYYFVIKQAVGAFLGLIAMIAAFFIDVEKLKKVALPLLIVSFVMLGLVFVPKIGVENYGAKRWINLYFFTFQPSEIAKFAYVLFCAWYVSLPKVDMNKFKYSLPIFGIGLIGCVLIILEPNMSITVCFGLLMLVLAYVGGTNFKTMLLIILPLAVVFPLLIIMEPYRMERLLAFIDPWKSPKDEGYQLIQSLYALGSGGWFGVGLFNSRQKLEFLPFAESDFIFSIIGEELGLFGALIVTLLFFVIIYHGVRLAINAETKYKSMLASGISAVIALQTLINLAVVTGSIPPTGLPLPFISYGGTSLVMFMFAAGVLLNLSKTPHNTI
ncbi:MAG TPA: putative lipid II flippase FtsW [Clostridia bacterium]|nr:putative lipid II flippase FtsW [Clostridia bacterium]